MGEYGAVFQNEPVDISEEFARQENHFFVCDGLEEFDPEAALGRIRWKSFSLKQRVSYHQLTVELEDYKVWEDLPSGEYEDDRSLPFDLSFITPRTVRLRLSARPEGSHGRPTLMLQGEPPVDDFWKVNDNGSHVTFRGPSGSVTVEREPLHFEFRDAGGKLLTRSHHLSDTAGVVNAKPTPFSFVRNTATFHRHIAASFGLSPGEKLFGCGESFTRLDKRGQKLVLWTYDAYSAQTSHMYKPVPFFMSDRGYGIFVHTSAPLTFDLGSSHDGAATFYLGDDQLDLFFFFGTPKEILSEYTALTGRAPLPPLWTFGLWMGRQTYSSERGARGREQAPAGAHTLGCDPPRHRLDRGSEPLRLRVLPLPLRRPEEDAGRSERERFPREPVAASLLQPQEQAAPRGHRQRLRGADSQRRTAR